MSAARIINPDDAPTRVGADIGFTAETMIHAVGKALETEQLQINVLRFKPGERSRPHIHPYDQVLFYGGGAGVVAVGGGEDLVVPEGSFAILPANVVHMHGAGDHGPAWHISMMRESSTGYEMPVPASWQHWVL